MEKHEGRFYRPWIVSRVFFVHDIVGDLGPHTLSGYSAELGVVGDPFRAILLCRQIDSPTYSAGFSKHVVVNIFSVFRIR